MAAMAAEAADAAEAGGRPSLLARHAFELLIFVVCALLAALCVVSAPIILEAGAGAPREAGAAGGGRR